MCTYIDEQATEKMKNRLKGKKIAYAWKVVKVKDSHFYAPFFVTVISNIMKFLENLK
jgi:hypothetical protein